MANQTVLLEKFSFGTWATFYYRELGLIERFLVGVTTCSIS